MQIYSYFRQERVSQQVAVNLCWKTWSGNVVTRIHGFSEAKAAEKSIARVIPFQHRDHENKSTRHRLPPKKKDPSLSGLPGLHPGNYVERISNDSRIPTKFLIVGEQGLSFGHVSLVVL